MTVSEIRLRLAEHLLTILVHSIDGSGKYYSILPVVCWLNFFSPKGATDGGGKSKSDSFTHKEVRQPDSVHLFTPILTPIMHWQLKDLFTVHAHTPCHTHELLECPCANTPSNSSSQPRDDTYEESCDLDAECDNFEAKFMSASQVNPENMNRLDKTVCSVLTITNGELTMSII